MRLNMLLPITELTSPSPPGPRGQSILANTGSLVHCWVYRIGSYVLLNFVDDPAWLALMFC